MSSNRLGLVVGSALLGMVAVSGVRDLSLYTERWSTWGPLGPAEPVPAFTARGIDGPDLDAASLPGQVTVLAFWATWCGPCAREMPTLAALDRDYRERGVRVIGVNRDREGNVPELVRAYKAERGLEFPVVHDDGRMGQVFRVSMIPHLVLLDARGEIRHVHQGQVSASTLRSELEALLAAAP